MKKPANVIPLPDLPPPPPHLGDTGKALWRDLQAAFDLVDTDAQLLLDVCCQAYERALEARAAINREGLQTADRFGQFKPHPLLPVERDSRGQVMAAVKALGLNVEPLQPMGRPPGR
jgi:P27 family predicted phage terminase small subunit